MDRILNMIFRRLLNKGINTGIRAAANRGRTHEDETPQQRQQNQQRQKQGQQTAKGVRQATRVLRRLNKF